MHNNTFTRVHDNDITQTLSVKERLGYCVKSQKCNCHLYSSYKQNFVASDYTQEAHLVVLTSWTMPSPFQVLVTYQKPELL